MLTIRTTFRDHRDGGRISGTRLSTMSLRDRDNKLSRDALERLFAADLSRATRSITPVRRQKPKTEL